MKGVSHLPGRCPTNPAQQCQLLLNCESQSCGSVFEEGMEGLVAAARREDVELLCPGFLGPKTVQVHIYLALLEARDTWDCCSGHGECGVQMGTWVHGVRQNGGPTGKCNGRLTHAYRLCMLWPHIMAATHASRCCWRAWWTAGTSFARRPWTRCLPCARRCPGSRSQMPLPSCSPGAAS